MKYLLSYFITTAVHTAQTRLHQTVHDSLLVDTVGRVRSNGAQRLACIAASAYRISKIKKEGVLNVLIFFLMSSCLIPTICLAISSVIAFIAMSLKTLLYSLHLICQRQFALFQQFNENRSVFFDHSIEHIMKNISNL